MTSIGVMQGRLVPDENNRIQSFPKNNWRKEFNLINILGIKYMEWTFDHNELFKNPLLDPTGIKEISELKLLNNIEILSATADNFMQAPVHKQNNHKQSTVGECLEFLNKISSAGIKLLVWPLVDTGNLNNKHEFEDFREIMNLISDKVIKYELKIAFETDLPSIWNLKLIKDLDPSFFGINLDIGNLASYGFSISQEVDLLGDRILHVHIKDRLFRGPTVPLGQGDVDWIEASLFLRNFTGLKILQAARNANEFDTISHYLKFCERNRI